MSFEQGVTRYQKQGGTCQAEENTGQKDRAECPRADSGQQAFWRVHPSHLPSFTEYAPEAVFAHTLLLR